jgi:hypothetical protein
MRSYTKIQEVFASIGGFAKFFYVIISLFHNFSIEIYRNIFLFNTLLFENETYENEKKAKRDLNNYKIKFDNKDEIQNSNNTNNLIRNSIETSQLPAIGISHRENINRNNSYNTVKNTFLKNKERTVFGIRNNTGDHTSQIRVEPRHKNNLNKLNITRKVINNPKISYSKYLMFKFCWIKPKFLIEKDYLENINLYSKIFEKPLDIKTYFEFYNQFKHFIKHVLEKNERKNLKILKRPTRDLPKT